MAKNDKKNMFNLINNTSVADFFYCCLSTLTPAVRTYMTPSLMQQRTQTTLTMCKEWYSRRQGYKCTQSTSRLETLIDSEYSTDFAKHYRSSLVFCRFQAIIFRVYFWFWPLPIVPGWFLESLFVNRPTIASVLEYFIAIRLGFVCVVLL